MRALEGLNVVDFMGKWGDERDQIIRDSKILLNIHWNPQDYNIFESIRCYHALEYKTIVVSQESTDPELVLLKDMIIFLLHILLILAL